MELFIMAAGKSSRFGSPKILETFEWNKNIFKNFGITPIIVTTSEIYEDIKHLKSEFLIGDFQKGSGADIYKLHKILGEINICWSDVFFLDSNIDEFLSGDFIKTNYMTVTYREKAYVSFEMDKNNIIFGYTKHKTGWQDNSIFKIRKLNNNQEDFLDLVIMNNFFAYKAKKSTLYFNTKKELNKIKEILKEIK